MQEAADSAAPGRQTGKGADCPPPRQGWSKRLSHTAHLKCQFPCWGQYQSPQGASSGHLLPVDTFANTASKISSSIVVQGPSGGFSCVALAIMTICCVTIVCCCVGWWWCDLADDICCGALTEAALRFLLQQHLQQPSSKQRTAVQC